MKPHISLIVARSRNGVIGFQGKMPWHLPEDLKFFKQTTMGKPVIMGRKTRESIGRALPGRRNIVVTRNPSYCAAGTECASSFEEAVSLFSASDSVFVIGGGELYRQALPLADTAWITEVDAEFEGDTFFDPLPADEWKLVWSEPHPKNENTPLGYTFKRFDRFAKIRF